MVMSGMFVLLGIIGIKVLSQFISVSPLLFLEIVSILVIVIIRFVPVATNYKSITASEKILQKESNNHRLCRIISWINLYLF